jgi:tripartite-type tricarboxylate transporter receptor subunit TctC
VDRIPVTWKNLTPIALVASDQFILWVLTESPLKSVKDVLDAGKAGGLKFGGTGAYQEDRLIAAEMEKVGKFKVAYRPFRGGGDVAVALAKGDIDVTVNNPAEGALLWSEGKIRPLCVFDAKRMPQKTKINGDAAWADVPTCQESGLPISYKMMRGIFAPPGLSADQVAYYEGAIAKATQSPKWKAFLDAGALDGKVVSGAAFKAMLESESERHAKLLARLGFTR